MDGGLDSDWTYEAALAALRWQVELGADEAILDAPVNRYALAEREVRAPAATPTSAKRGAPPPPPMAEAKPDHAAMARDSAARATSLEALAEAMRAAPSDLRDTARNFVFADGNPKARVMIVGEAPGREEDLEGRPFVGVAGQLLDRMLSAIGLDRRSPDTESAVYITNVLPWRPPNNRTPEPAEMAQFLPYLTRHIELADPEVLILLGNTPLKALLNREGITRERGKWAEVLGRPALPMLHPAYLLRNTAAKRESWADLLEVKARLMKAPKP